MSAKCFKVQKVMTQPFFSQKKADIWLVLFHQIKVHQHYKYEIHVQSALNTGCLLSFETLKIE